MIRGYKDKDLHQIIKITKHFWSQEVPMDNYLEDFIYSFLVLYYLSNKEISFVYEEQKEIKAFLLSSKVEDKNNCMEYFNLHFSKLNKGNQEKALLYLDYLNYNHQKVLSYMDSCSIYLALIASLKSHIGSELIEHLKSYAKAHQLNSIYLWTDETCNYTYYEKKHFILVESYTTTLYEEKLKTFIYKLSL